MKRIKYFFLMMMTVLGISSCDFKDVDDSGMGYVDVDFDFSGVGSVPNSMKVFFYPVGGIAVDMIKQGYTTMDWTPKNKRIALPDGVYNVTAFNMDGDHVFYDNEDVREKLRLTTDRFDFSDITRAVKTPESIVDSIYPGCDLLYTPDYVIKANEELYYVNDLAETNQMTMVADSMITDVSITIKGIEGLQFVTSCSGVLGGLAKYGQPLKDGVPTDSAVMGFPVKINASEKEIKARFNVWGLEPADAIGDTTHKLTLFFWMDDAKVFVTKDITEETKNGQYKDGVFEIEAYIDLNVRESVGGAGGFDINLSPWDEEHLDIGM